MTRDRPSQPTRRSGAATTPMSGASAALHLVPVAAFMVDEQGGLHGCNDLFEEIAGVPYELLLGREWWQAFAALSEEAASRAHEAMVQTGETRGRFALSLVRSDGAPCGLELHWQRLTEPGTRRFLWTIAAHEALPRERRASSAAPRSSEPATELAALLSAELDGLSADSLADHRERLLRMARVLRAEHPLPERASLPVADVVKRAIGGVMHDAERPVRVRFDARNTVRSAPVDPARALALVVDSARARCAVPAVIVEVTDTSEGVRFDVQDFGPPIDASLRAQIERPRLFDRDEHAPLDALVRASALVRALGGRIELSVGPEGGQRVRLELPR